MRISDWSSDVCSSDLGDRSTLTSSSAALLPRVSFVASSQRSSDASPVQSARPGWYRRGYARKRLNDVHRYLFRSDLPVVLYREAPARARLGGATDPRGGRDRKSTRLNSSH